MEYPRVLVIGTNAWRDEGSIHTLIDIFSHWQKDKLAHVYARATPPNTVVCDRFFQISENEVLKSIFKPWHTVGRRVVNAPQFSPEDLTQMEEEKKRYARARKKHSWLMTCWASSSCFSSLSMPTKQRACPMLILLSLR